MLEQPGRQAGGRLWQGALIIHLLGKLVQTFAILPHVSVTNERWPCLGNCRQAASHIHAVHSKADAESVLVHASVKPGMGILLNDRSFVE